MDWYEQRDQFIHPGPLNGAFHTYAGPKGPALVNVYTDGRTTPGWGQDFLTNYNARVFRPEPRLRAFKEAGDPFAIVMRSVNIVCFDLDDHWDGPNGLIGARALNLPRTLAETSKSGGGRHLFYRTGSNWDNGYDLYRDIIGLIPGVDVRAVGCVYHYETQRWNTADIAMLPAHLEQKLSAHAATRNRERLKLAALRNADPNDPEVLIMHDHLIQELAKPIPPGKRNNTLFAIGSKMNDAGVEDWETLLSDRGTEIGLDGAEIDKIISNIGTYSP